MMFCHFLVVSGNQIDTFFLIGYPDINVYEQLGISYKTVFQITISGTYIYFNYIQKRFEQIHLVILSQQNVGRSIILTLWSVL